MSLTISRCGPEDKGQHELIKHKLRHTECVLIFVKLLMLYCINGDGWMEEHQGATEDLTSEYRAHTIFLAIYEDQIHSFIASLIYLILTH